MEPRETLPDLLGRRLDLVICGTAAGRHSASASAYYADSSNRLRWIPHEVGLTPRKLVPEEFRVLLEFAIGLTDLAKLSRTACCRSTARRRVPTWSLQPCAVPPDTTSHWPTARSQRSPAPAALAVATRNVRGFEDIEVEVVDPWETA